MPVPWLIASKVIAKGEFLQMVVVPPPAVAGSGVVPFTETATSTAGLTIRVWL